MASPTFTKKERAQLAAQGISLAEAERQLQILRSPEHHPLLDRPCTREDGIQRIATDQQPALIAIHEQAAATGRWLKFVPASGAASRMFALHEEDSRARLTLELRRFAFYDDLERCLRAAGRDLCQLLDRGEYKTIADFLLHRPGLGYAETAKGLLPFHRYGSTSRTAFEEHLREAAECLREASGRCRAHFTVLPAHQRQFEALLAQLQPKIRAECGTRLDVDFSQQDRSTETLALDRDGTPLRTAAGDLVLRPGGHGALLGNVDALGADLVLVENIDNICHERLRGPTLTWVRVLGGCLVHLQDQIHQHLRGLESAATPAACEQAEQFIAARLPGSAGRWCDPATWEQRSQQLQRLLHRPLRVCGMVVNDGDPGGGPYWVTEPDGRQTLQIVESSEVDLRHRRQQEIVQAATHFNPVFMVLALRDHHGRPYPLDEFVNGERFITSHKFQHGHAVRVLERPGLWNGSMHHWNTMFVEVPAGVFSPVKSIFDLLHPEHQESAGGEGAGDTIRRPEG